MDNLLTEMASVYTSFSNITHHKEDSDIHLTVSWKRNDGVLGLFCAHCLG